MSMGVTNKRYHSTSGTFTTITYLGHQNEPRYSQSILRPRCDEKLFHGITQSAVSQQLRAQELKYQISRVERNRRACGLTPEGRTFLDAARPIWNPARRSATIYAARRATSSVGSTSHRNLPSVGTIYRRSSKPSAKVTPQWKSSCNICIRLKCASPSPSPPTKVDLGLVAYPQIRRGLKFEPFGEDEPVVIYHRDHDPADRRPIELSALATENYIAFSPDAPTVRHLERSWRKHQADLTPAVQSDNVETVKRAVEIKGGFSLKDIRLERPLAIAFKPTRTRGTVVRAY